MAEVMSGFKTYKINEGVKLSCFTDSRFKTMRISVNMFVPLKEESAAKFGILPSLVSRATKEYPDYTIFGEKLSELYGAYINSSVSKLGGHQVISLAAAGIASRYAFDGEDMVKELSSILFSILFSPLKDEKGLFPAEGFEQEKRQVLEVFDAEFNDKIQYARTRCLECYFEGMPQGIGRYGKKEEVEKLTISEVTEAWDELISKAKFEIFVLGDCSPDIAYFEDTFKDVGKSYKSETPAIPQREARTITEDMQLSQSKLVMAFRADMNDDEKMAFRLMSAVFGGTPSAKLFVNVREKMSLCYYCSSRVYAESKLLTVESGVETENIEKTREAVLEQLKILQSGELTDEEIMSAKLAMVNSFKGVNDSLGAVENWYLNQCFLEKAQSPEAAVDEVMSITKEQIINAANKISLDTVYILKGQAN